MIGQAEKDAVIEVLESGMLAQGPRVRAFEEQFAAYCGVKHAVAVANGTAALQLALLAAGVGPGDRVAVPAFTFIATATAVRMTGAEPVFTDVREDDFAMDPEDLARSGAKAAIPVDLYGQCASWDELQEVADRAGIVLIEDCCQSHGSELGGRKAGAFGAAGCFSFYPTKNMTTGEGGMITTDDDEIAERCRLLRNHGMGATRYEYRRFGYNLRMTEIEAAIGIVQLKRLEGFNERRRAIAAMYDKGFADAALSTPAELPGRHHVYHQYTVRVKGRDAVRDAMTKAGIGTGVYYPAPLTDNPVFADAEAVNGLPRTRQLCSEVLSIPIHPGLSDENVREVVSTLRSAVGDRAG